MTWSRRNWQYPSLIALTLALVGCAGEAGPAGAKGDPGAPGATGPAGETGSTGDPGADAVTTGGLTGKVTDAVSGAGIAGAKVTAGDLSADTDAAGQFMFADISIGAYAMTVTADGYNDGLATVGVAAGKTSTVNFNLSAVTVENQPPTVSLTEQHAVGYGAKVTITADASDPENGALTYAWKQLSGPPVVLAPDNGTVTFDTAALADVVETGLRATKLGPAIEDRRHCGDG